MRVRSPGRGLVTGNSGAPHQARRAGERGNSIVDAPQGVVACANRSGMGRLAAWQPPRNPLKSLAALYPENCQAALSHLTSGRNHNPLVGGSNPPAATSGIPRGWEWRHAGARMTYSRESGLPSGAPNSACTKITTLRHSVSWWSIAPCCAGGWRREIRRRVPDKRRRSGRHQQSRTGLRLGKFVSP